ncbi:MAG: hypothetical protein ACRD2Z_14505 [Thermoanaerobaculia bacterium]
MILKKLAFYREGGSEKHLRDVAGVIKISGDELDWTYLQDWAERLHVADIWRNVLARSRCHLGGRSPIGTRL